MKSELAKARDKWLLSDDGKECCHGTATGQYLQNRLERAFLAGANISSERIKELKIENAKLNIILFHRENGLSHPDFNAEIEISKQVERIKELKGQIKAYESRSASVECPKCKIIIKTV